MNKSTIVPWVITAVASTAAVALGATTVYYYYRNSKASSELNIQTSQNIILKEKHVAAEQELYKNYQEKLVDKVNECTDHVSYFRTEATNALQEKEMLKNSMVYMEQEYENRVNVMETRLADLQQQLATAQEECARLSNRCIRIEQDKDYEVAVAVAEVQDKLNNQTTEAQQLLSRITNMESEIKEKLLTIKKLQEEKACLDDLIKNLNVKDSKDQAVSRRTIDDHFQRLNDRIGQTQAENANLQTQINQMQSENANLRAQINQMQLENATLQTQINQPQADNTDVQAQINQPQADNTDVQAQISQPQADNTDVQAQINQPQAEDNSLQN